MIHSLFMELNDFFVELNDFFMELNDFFMELNDFFMELNDFFVELNDFLQNFVVSTKFAPILYPCNTKILYRISAISYCLLS